jgi:hypothetical protein
MSKVNNLPIVLSFIILLFIGGCQSLGPHALRVGRPRYNFALQETDKQMLLLNLVRLRYNDNPSFLEIANIFAAPLLAGSVGGGVGGIGKTDLYDINANVSYAETPVIVYVPLSGEKFARHLLTPIDFNTLALLANGGWNFDRIWRVCIQSMNGVSNAEFAAGPTPLKAPEYEKFQRISKTLEWLDMGGHLDVGRTKETKKNDQIKEIQFSIDPGVLNKPEVQQMLKDLKLNPKANTYKVVPSVTGGGGDTIAVVTRPVLSAMFFLSQSVEIPEDDISSNAVTVTLDDRGNAFDWQKVTAGLMNIRSSDVRPSRSYVATQYRNKWYYISDDDVESKKTFFLLQILFTLQAGHVPQSKETQLTLPVR